MAMTVTATQTGTATKNGIGLCVRVVTGAFPPAAQNGATFAGNTTALNTSLTPHAVGSQVYTAIISYGSGSGSYTWEPAETGLFVQADPANTAVAGNALLTSVTSSLTPITVGASAGPGPNYHFAVAEILGMTSTSLADDPSAPAPVYNSAGISVTTASFTPALGALLVALVEANTTASGTQGITVSDSTSLTWKQLVINPGGFPNTGVWVAQLIAPYQYMAPYPVIYPQYLGPAGTFSPSPGLALGSFTAASNVSQPVPPNDGRWAVGGAFSPRFAREFARERDIPRSGWSIHDELCHHCLKRHRHICQE